MQALEKVAAILLPHATVAGELQLHSHTAKGFETKTYPLDLHHIDHYFTLLLSPMNKGRHLIPLPRGIR